MSSPTTQVPSPNDVCSPAVVSPLSENGAAVGAGAAVPGVAAGTALMTCGGVYVDEAAVDPDCGADFPLLPSAATTNSSTNRPPTTHGHFRFFFGAGGGT